MTKRKSRSSKSAAAPKAPIRVMSASDALRKKAIAEEHQLCHLDSERASRLRKRPTRF